MRRLPYENLLLEPWKNGGGVTRTIWSKSPSIAGAPFDWRVSIAEISKAGLFSRFPGIHRIAVVLENGPLHLTESPPPAKDNSKSLIGPDHRAIGFSGDDQYHASMTGKTILCLNIMARRSFATACIRNISSETAVYCTSETLLFSAGTGWQVAGAPLKKYESLLPDRSRFLKVTSPGAQDGPLYLISFHPA